MELDLVDKPDRYIKMKIAFGHKMGSGKDTAVSYLVSRYGGKRLAFATPLYDIQEYAQRTCGFKLEKDRRFLQMVGTEWARRMDPDVWIRLLLGNAPLEGNSYLSDLRFLNELEALKDSGWVCVKLVRPTAGERAGTGCPEHQSEQDLDNVPNSKWDHIIHNVGTIEEFHRELDNLVSKINDP